jgi:hypothetical protein
VRFVLHRFRSVDTHAPTQISPLSLKRTLHLAPGQCHLCPAAGGDGELVLVMGDECTAHMRDPLSVLHTQYYH